MRTTIPHRRCESILASELEFSARMYAINPDRPYIAHSYHDNEVTYEAIFGKPTAV